MKSAELLQKENASLKEKLLCREQLLADKNNTIKHLEEMIKSFQQRRFGTSSEKHNPDQLCLFNEAEALSEAEPAEEPAGITVASHTRKKKPRVSIPENLPREEIVYDLPELEKICPHDGSKLKHIGDDSHEQLDIIPARIKVIKHLRTKYACPCCESYMVTAKKPKLPIEKSIASPGLLAYIATNKYCDHLPLYRQSDMFQRIGVSMDRTNLANWIIKCGALVQPLINLMHDSILEQPVIHMDETPLQVLNEPGKSSESKSYMWLLASFEEQATILFHYSPTRSGSVATTLLQDYSNALIVDGYQGYQPVCNDNHIQRQGCWAHARRKFVDAKKVQAKGKVGKADHYFFYISFCILKRCFYSDIWRSSA